MKDEFQYNGQPLTKEQVKQMFETPDNNMEVIFSDDPPHINEQWGAPMVLPNWTIYMCTERATEPIKDINEEDEIYWVVAVENKNPTVEFTLDYVDEEFNQENLS